MTALLPDLDSNQDQPVNSRTLCRLSYRGSTDTHMLVRLLKHVHVNDNGCWLWTGAVNNKGYGQVGVDGTTRSAHRVAYEAAHGSVASGLQVDHTCHNADPACRGGLTCQHRRCVNPTHLEAVTQRVNMNRAGHGVETHCRRGHPLSGDNLFIKTHGNLPTTRGCRACRTAYQRERRRAEVAA